MKNYRVLWYKASANYNILYFVRITGTVLLDAIQEPLFGLWKTQAVSLGTSFEIA